MLVDRIGKNIAAHIGIVVYSIFVACRCWPTGMLHGDHLGAMAQLRSAGPRSS